MLNKYVISFLNLLVLAYKQRHLCFTFPYLMKPIMNICCILKRDGLIKGYFFDGKNHRVHVFFRYVLTTHFLYKTVKVFSRKHYLTNTLLLQLIRLKGSLLFPVYLIFVNKFGLVTDRQLMYLWHFNYIKTLPSGRVVAKLS